MRIFQTPILTPARVRLAYAIGIAEPVSVMINTFGTGRVPEDAIRAAVLRTFDLKPYGIIRDLRLRRPIYKQTAAYGHFGRNEEGFSWEEIDKASALKKGMK